MPGKSRIFSAPASNGRCLDHIGFKVESMAAFADWEKHASTDTPQMTGRTKTRARVGKNYLQMLLGCLQCPIPMACWIDVRELIALISSELTRRHRELRVRKIDLVKKFPVVNSVPSVNLSSFKIELPGGSIVPPQT
jgi:hypothetical protein